MDNLQLIKNNQQSKYGEIIEYLKQDNGYWMENDKWDLAEKFFIGRIASNKKNINFFSFRNEVLKNEIKYYFVYNFKNKLLSYESLASYSWYLDELAELLHDAKTLLYLDSEKTLNKWRLFISDKGLKIHKKDGRIKQYPNFFIKFIQDFYDIREETEKDIWDLRKIEGVKIRATQNRKTNILNFADIPPYYRNEVKRYFKTIITKKSPDHCFNVLVYLRYFFNSFYSRGYTDGFLEKLSRNDIEKYIVNLIKDRNNKSKEETNKYVTQLRIFLEKIQIFEYDNSPKTDVNRLIFNDDIPHREHPNDIIKRTKFVPEPILKQLDNNIMDLDRPQYIPIYILLRETGWRGTDILNLRYNNCLEQIWNKKEQKYNYYLCGEITKTGIAELKIPIRDKVAEMVQKAIDKAKELSTEENNPMKYLFNTYEGKSKGKPLSKQALMLTVQRLIEQKDIKDVTGELYHLKLHSLRHTRAKEYVEQGMGISIIQQILGHQSLQMTVHYATVTENTLYEKWKNTEDLDLFRVNTETNKLEQVDLNSDDGENLIRYEYVKKNLDAVRVPFGVCFKPSKLPCKQQMNHCLTCASFCTTVGNIPEYEEEINHVKKQIEVSERCGRELWAEKNKGYLELLEKTLQTVKEQKIVHKNGASREEIL